MVYILTPAEHTVTRWGAGLIGIGLLVLSPHVLTGLPGLSLSVLTGVMVSDG